MPDLKLSDLVVDGEPSPSDYVETLDVDDTSMGPAGSNKRVPLSVFFSYTDAAVRAAGRKSVPSYATTGPLPPCTYSNGDFGVQAALSGTDFGALPAIDGVTPAIADVFLVKDQVERLQNGVYQVDEVGDAGSPWLVSRVEGMDHPGGLAGLVAVVGGEVNGQTLWLGTTVVPPFGPIGAGPTVGTTPIDFLRIYSPR